MSASTSPGCSTGARTAETWHRNTSRPGSRTTSRRTATGALGDGRLAEARSLFTEEELKTSGAYNEGWRQLGGQNGLTVHFGAPNDLCVAWFLGDPAGGDGWESGQIRLVERLLPHLREFVAVRHALAAADALGAGLARTA